MKTTVAIICALIILGGCGKWPKDDELTLTRKPFLGDELCTDGYYYYRWKNDTSTFNILFLYKNGVVLALPNSLSTNELPEWEESFRNGEFYERYKNDKMFWGVFSIENSSIIYEKWGINEGGGMPVGQFSGPILSDTSFHIISFLEPKTGKTHGIDRIYYFKPFSPKPDSTNMFIP
jgi:hypothetical protein